MGGTLTALYTAWIAAFYWSITTMQRSVTETFLRARHQNACWRCSPCWAVRSSHGRRGDYSHSHRRRVSTRFRERLLEIEEFFCSAVYPWVTRPNHGLLPTQISFGAYF